MSDRLDAILTHWATIAPDSTAVRFAGRSFTYHDLETAAKCIAAQIVRAGVVSGDRVALYANKGFYAIAAVFGVLRAGAVYVPIDPGAPQTRVNTILEDCGVVCILADPMHVGAVGKVQTVLEISEAATRAEEIVPIPRELDDLAYILYTSGSTGTPKGICHTHKSGLAYARMAADLCRLTTQDRVSHHTPLHFDMSIFDIFASVVAGATIVVIPEMHAKLPASLSKLVQDESVSVWYSVPFALAQLVDRGCLLDRDLSKLRCVMFAGEVMPPRVLADFAKHVPHAELLNAYGPTETNHCVTARVDQEKLDGVSAVSIGVPDAGTKIRISSEGELLVAGDQVMAGYWNDPVRTDDAMDHSAEGEGFYRTGDIVTQAQDGQLFLVGRADRQVKIRGHRVELDEVERTLGAMAGVTELAVVFAAGDDAIGVVYSGCIVPDDILRHAQDRLPKYMVPGTITQVTALARTSTGKIDRRRLLRMNDDRSAA